MGAAWCKDRAAKAQDSKSPFDRVIVKCANQMALSDRQKTQIPTSRLTETERPIERMRTQPNTSGWTEVVLKVPDLPEQNILPEKAPVPPPRKKKINRANQVEKPARTHATIIKKPPTPVIYLEVDTPLSRQKSKSSSSLPTQIDARNKPNAELGNERSVLVDSESDLLKLPRRVSSSMSVTSRRSITSVSEATSERLDNYLKSCRSFGSLKPEEVISEINLVQSDASSDSDAWAGLDDWDLGIAEHYDSRSPLTPTSQLARRKERQRAKFTLGDPDKKSPSDETRTKSETRKRKTNSGKKTSAGVKSDVDVVINKPVNFRSNLKPHNENDNTKSNIIKPSQIPVHDFLRQSSTEASPPPLNEKRKFNLKVDVPSDSQTFSFDFAKGLMPPRSPQIELPGTPNTPRGLSRCSSPLPAQLLSTIQTTTPPSSPSTEEKTAFSWTSSEQEANHSSLLRMLNEYHAVAEIIGDEDVAKQILEGMTIPESVKSDKQIEENNHEVVGNRMEHHISVNVKNVPTSNGSSGHSSMTPSLTELEAALSDLLEATGDKEDHDQDEDELKIEPEMTFSPIKVEQMNQITHVDHKMEVALKPEITITIEKQDTPKIVVEIDKDVGKTEKKKNQEEETKCIFKEQNSLPVLGMLRKSKTDNDLTKLDTEEPASKDKVSNEVH